jgi:hypothetical protein
MTDFAEEGVALVSGWSYFAGCGNRAAALEISDALEMSDDC